MTPLARYQADLKRDDFTHDPAQERAVKLLQELYDRLMAGEARTRRSLFDRFRPQRGLWRPVPGLYLWGGVGRGKTYVVDMFFDCLPFAEKKRTHFHRFMSKVHEQLKGLRDQKDPLAVIGQRFAESARVLCFDEFIVNDIGDAIILAGLLRNLFERGVTLVATSNIEPDGLYKDGLQRDRFLPAIEMIKQNTQVVEVDGGTDYRLEFLDHAQIYFCPLDERAEAGLLYNFEHVAPESGHTGVVLEVEGREINTVRHADGVVWFDFREICGGPRSQNDYLELARCFHTMVVSNIPRLDADTDDQGRRLINLIDVMYDRNVKLIASAEAEPSELYSGTRLAGEFQRTASRMNEMRAHDYLAKKHLP